MVAVTERMHVVAGGGADVAQRREFRGGDAGEVLFRGQLDVGAFALEYADRHARPFRERGIVGEIVAAGRARTPVRRQQGVEIEGLRGLHRAQAIAVEGIDHVSGGVDGLDGVGRRQAGNGGARRARGDGTRDQGRGGKRAGGIVNQHDARPVPLQRLEPGAHRDLSRCAAEHGIAQMQSRRGCAKPRDIVAVDHRLDHSDLGMGCKQAQCMTDDGGAVDGAVLLRRIASDAGSAPGRDHNHRHRRCRFALHRLPL